MGKIEWAMWANEQALAAGLSKNKELFIYLIIFLFCLFLLSKALNEEVTLRLH